MQAMRQIPQIGQNYFESMQLPQTLIAHWHALKDTFYGLTVFSNRSLGKSYKL